MFKELKNDLEIIFCINAGDIEKNKTRGEYGITYDQEIVISEFPHVQFINLQCNSFPDATKLTISKLPELQIIKVESLSFFETESIIFSGMNSLSFLIWNFLNFILFIVVENLYVL